MADALPEYEVFAIRYATRDAKRREHFIMGDPHDTPMPMYYFVWAAKSPDRTFIIDTGFTAEEGAKRKRTFLRCQPFNVPPLEKRDLYGKWGIGGIIRMDRDGKNREVYASGIRNSVGMDFNPKDKTLWFTDNQVDGMGDDIPPGELNRSTKDWSEFWIP